MYRYLAIASIGCGAAIAVAVIWAAVAQLLPGSGGHTLIGGALLALTAVIAGSLIHTGINHRRRPSQKSALALAANSSVLLWLILASIVASSGLPEWIGPAHALVALGIAFLVYRTVLRPAAIRGFRPNDQTANPPPGTRPHRGR